MTLYTMFQQADTAVSAQKQRLSQGLITKGFAAGTGSTTRLDGIGGVQAQPNSFRVQAQGSPNMTTAVSRGNAVIPGMENAAQGNYYFSSDATVNVTHATAHATLYYIDSVVIRVKDAAFSGASNLGEIVAVRGTAATLGSVVPPSAVTIGNSYLELGRVTIRPATSSVLNTDILDVRHWLTAPGGISIPRTHELADVGMLSGDARFADNQVEVWSATDSLWHGHRTVLIDQPAQSFTGDIVAGATQKIAGMSIPWPGFPYRIKAWGAILVNTIGTTPHSMQGNINIDDDNYRALVGGGTVPHANTVAWGIATMPVGDAAQLVMLPGYSATINNGATHNLYMWVKHANGATNITVFAGYSYRFLAELIPV